MLYLVFHVGSDRFAIEASRVVEVLPLVYWKEVPDSAVGVVGLINYHRTAVPLVDLSAHLVGTPSRTHLSTRILVVRMPLREDAELRESAEDIPEAPDLAGIIVERVSATLRCDPASFTPTAEMADTTPWLGPVRTDANGIVQRLELDHLLECYVRDANPR